MTVARDQVYATKERPLLWDVYRPEQPRKPTPVVVLLHGGGFVHGHRSMMDAAGRAFAERGFLAIAPEYRLVGEVDWPTPLADVEAAFAAVAERAADFGADPDLTFAAGYSAGAFLSLLIGARQKAVRAVAAFFPPSRLGPPQRKTLKLDEAGAMALSPLTNAGKLPPTILFCGDADPMTPVAMARDIYDAILAAGGQADLRLYSGLTHEFVELPGMMEATVNDAIAFFDRTVIHRGAVEAELTALHRRWQELLANPPG